MKKTITLFLLITILSLNACARLRHLQHLIEQKQTGLLRHISKGLILLTAQLLDTLIRQQRQSVRAMDAWTRSEGVGHYVYYGTLTFPVRRGEYYRVVYSATGSTEDGYVYFIPLQ